MRRLPVPGPLLPHLPVPEAPDDRAAPPARAETHLVATARTARVVVMGAASAPRAVVALHGYGQRADLFARHLAPHASADCRVVVPEALSRFYLDVPTPEAVRASPRRRPRVGASWMTREEREADIADLTAYLDTTAAAFVPPDAAVTGLGFSQGAAALVRWCVLGKADAPARLVLWGGLVPDDTLDALADGTVRLPPVTLVAGRADGYLAPETVAAHAARLLDLGVDAAHIAFDGGHALDAGVLADVLG